MSGTVAMFGIIAAVLLTFVVHLRLKHSRALPPRSRFPALEKLVVLITALCFILLLLTGFYDLALHKRHMTGYTLLAHVTAGAIYALFIVLFALFRAQWGRFLPSEGKNAVALPVVVRVLFWGLLVASVILLLTAALPMLTYFGTADQHASIRLHQYAAVMAFACAVPLAYAGLRRRPNPA